MANDPGITVNLIPGDPEPPAADAGASPARARTRPRLKAIGRSPAVLGTLGIVIALAIGELAPILGLVKRDVFPPIGDSLSALITQVQLGSFWTAVGETMKGWALGVVIAFVLGVALGALTGANRTLDSALRPTIDFLRSIPGIAALPLAILVFGNFFKEKVFLIVLGAIWYFVIQTNYGVRSVDTVARDTVRSFGFGPLARTRHLVLPSALPYIATGLRLVASIALAVCVTVELLSGAPGIGQQILVASQSVTSLPVMYALIIFTGLLGIVIQVVCQRLERYMLRWHPSQQPGNTDVDPL